MKMKCLIVSSFAFVTRVLGVLFRRDFNSDIRELFRSSPLVPVAQVTVKYCSASDGIISN